MNQAEDKRKEPCGNMTLKKLINITCSKKVILRVSYKESFELRNFRLKLGEQFGTCSNCTRRKFRRRMVKKIVKGSNGYYQHPEIFFI
nr:MAG TPA: hypothetical protein [Caudoviricetes sp.]